MTRVTGVNEIVHFFTGYLLARALKYKEHRFECFFMAFAAFLPDIDYIIGLFVPGFLHGVYTHTILSAVALAAAWALVAWLALRKPWQGAFTPGKLYLHLLGLAVLGALSHLALDAFTFYESAADQVHHVYFWPVWDFPVHINTMFPGTTYGTRVAVEVIYSVAVGVTILVLQWAWKKQNPFKMLVPSNWLSPSNDAPARGTTGKVPRPVLTLAIGAHAVLVFYIVLAVI